MEIDFTLNPSSKDLEFLTKRINDETEEYGFSHPFAFFVRDGQKNIVAECNGFLIYGAIYTDQLWVERNYRRKGYGKKLMESVQLRPQSGSVQHQGEVLYCPQRQDQHVSFLNEEQTLIDHMQRRFTVINAKVVPLLSSHIVYLRLQIWIELLYLIRDALSKKGIIKTYSKPMVIILKFGRCKRVDFFLKKITNKN